MDLALKNLLDIFKVKDESSLLKAKSEGKQVRFTMACHKPKMVEMTAEKCKGLCEKAGIEYQSGYESRVLEGLTTNETTDRYGDIVRHDGCKFDNYLKNPVVMLSHEHGNFPIGNSIKIWKDPEVKGIYSWDLYIDNRVDTTGRADQAFKFRQSGIMPGISIGFIPLSVKNDHTPEEKKKIGVGKWGVEFLAIDYLEHSQVSIPANPDALTNALNNINRKEFGEIFSKDDIFTLEKLKWFPDTEILNIFEDYLKPVVLHFDTNIIDQIGTLLSDNDLEEINKDIVLRPYPNEHACRLEDPDQFVRFFRKKVKDNNDVGGYVHTGKEYSLIIGYRKDKSSAVQAHRYPKDSWDADQARKHCKAHKGSFTAAKEDDKNLECPSCNFTPAQDTVLTNKLDEVIMQLKSISDKLSSPAASKASDVDEVMYSSDLLKSFSIKPKA